MVFPAKWHSGGKMKTPASAQKNLLTGLLYLGIALFFGVQSFGLGIGKVDEMGPGFYPLVLSVLLTIAGVVVILSGRSESGRVSPIHWRGLVFVLGGLMLFALLATGAGFVPAAWLAVYFSTYASKKIGRKTAIIVATVFTVVAWFVFLKCLDIPIRPFGPWIIK